jgi:purine nucleoside permease
MKSRIIAVVAAVAIATVVGPGTAMASAGSGAPAPAPSPSGAYKVRVLVMTMFSGETQPWLENEKLPITINVPGAFGPLHCTVSSGLCVTTIGEGKSNAAVSVTAILSDSKLNFSGAYFMTAGIAGTPPGVGTLGFAAWARYVVDWDLGHRLVPTDAPNLPYGYEPLSPADYAEVFNLNASLAQLAYNVTKSVQLVDSPEAVQARAEYPDQAGKKPFVALCDTVSGDDYFAGAGLSAEAQYIMSLDTNNEGTYCTTEQEDSATAAALSRFGYLGRYLDLRTASDFDQPYVGETVEQLLNEFPGYTISTTNAYLVGSTMANYLLNH